MSVVYFDRAGWEFLLSEECRPGGNGQCDGYDADGTDCECVCHKVYKAQITTVKQVERMHRLGWIFEGIDFAHLNPTVGRVVYTHPEA